MSTGIFANETTSACTAPLLDESLFPQKGGYLPGRYCGLGSFQIDGGTASCCFPCPIQDYIYAPNWRTRLRIPNYLSILSVTLCTFLLLSFLALPPSKTHRHYLSVGLLIPVLLRKNLQSRQLIRSIHINEYFLYNELANQGDGEELARFYNICFG
ncbi:hypothetical protein PtrM4_148240 [Pyrenophora tritici-repentis]|uniref:Uncharacterized protein n=1 Tax=Pyrenophora tritici-repentis TaxID=45151 RepID=A0A834RN50_9PLEO|nr:hypothetical protein PtrM4_148240 [Pyrenophora tritici-repentis]